MAASVSPLTAAMRAQAGANAAQLEAAQKVGGTFQKIGGIFVPIGGLFTIFVTGVLLWAGVKSTGGDIGFKKALLIPAWTNLITLLQMVAISLLIIWRSNSGEAIDITRDATVSIVRFMPADLPDWRSRSPATT